MEAPQLCIACDAPAPASTFYARRGYRLVRCPSCALVYQSPQPGDEVLDSSYYSDPAFAAALFADDDLRGVALANARRNAGHLGGRLELAGKRVLDVGASSGAFVRLAGELGADATGIEPGPALSAGARDEGLDVRSGTLAEVAAGLGDGSFDLITFWDVLEHLRDPREELAVARRLLSPGGRVAATFPNVAGLMPRVTYRAFARRTGVWEYAELPVHLHDFSPETATRVFERCGFAVDEIRTFATPFSFYRSTTLAPERLGTSAKAWAFRAAFEGIRLVVYPMAALTGRGNSQFVLARSPRLARDA